MQCILVWASSQNHDWILDAQENTLTGSRRKELRYSTKAGSLRRGYCKQETIVNTIMKIYPL
jgi:lambda repressor-like predicted transcriptional regulator